MKQIIILFLVFNISLFSSIFDNLKSFSANFEQKIINEHGQSISYKGKILIKKPHYSKWEYKKPIVKTVYMKKNKLVIVDKELEQVTISSITNQLNFISLLKSAKKIKANYYMADYSNMKFSIFLKKSKIHKVSYIDEVDNSVIFIFKNQKNNLEISNKKFEYSIPNGYDILR